MGEKAVHLAIKEWMLMTCLTGMAPDFSAEPIQTSLDCRPEVLECYSERLLQRRSPLFLQPHFAQ
jgi:hypothetical protein